MKLIKEIIVASVLLISVGCGSDTSSEKNEALMEEISAMENATEEIEKEIKVIIDETDDLEAELDSMLNEI